MPPQDHATMWRDLGLDLDAHSGGMQVHGQAYGHVYLTQDGRPAAMEAIDAVVGDIHGGRVAELLAGREEGRKVFGAFCLYAPEELVLAAGGTLIGLCAGADVGAEEAEKLLPASTCPLVKAFVGFKMAGLCPYVEACDLVIGETTCDGKTKAYELFGDLHPTFVVEIPHTKTVAAFGLWLSEVKRLAVRVEEVTGRTITVSSLREGIRTVNAKRDALRRLSRLRAAKPAPISGRDALLVNQLSFFDDPERFTGFVHLLCDELEQRAADGVGVTGGDGKRILVSGCPMAIPNWKVPFVVEGSGAVIVGEESCVGDRGTQGTVAEEGESLEELYEAVARRYFGIDCAVFTPNDARLERIVAMARELGADGVVHYALQFCTPYETEAALVRRALREEGIPLLELTTDYGMGDAPQLSTRVQAFLEML